MTPLELLIVDDQALFREGLRLILDTFEDLTVVEECASGLAAIRAERLLEPDVILMDIRMPGERDGVEATRTIIERNPDAAILILTTFDDDALVFEGLRAGARGYLLKDAGREQLHRAIRTVAGGETFLPPQIAGKVVREFNRLAHRRVASHEVLDALTRREREVLGLVARGLSNKAIAAQLHLTEGTVKNHMTQILAKLEVADRTQAALLAREAGLAD